MIGTLAATIGRRNLGGRIASEKIFRRWNLVAAKSAIAPRATGLNTSEPGARHSRNLAARPEVALVVFDSCQRPGTGEGVYVAARAERVPEDDLERCLDVYAAASRAQGLADWRRADVEAPSRHRLYRATAIEHFVLSAGDERVPVAMPPG